MSDAPSSSAIKAPLILKKLHRVFEGFDPQEFFPCSGRLIHVI